MSGDGTTEVAIAKPKVVWLPIETAPRDPRKRIMLFTSLSNTEVGTIGADGVWRVGVREIDPLFWSPVPDPPDGLAQCTNCVRVVPSDRAVRRETNTFCGDLCCAEFYEE